MPQLYWILNIDMSNSSLLKIGDQHLEKVYRTLENFFRFTVESMVNIPLPEEAIAWAGEGGFAVFDASSKIQVTEILSIAKAFSKYINLFINKNFIGINSNLQTDYRIIIANVNAEPSKRISNYAGKMLSLILKCERQFGTEGHINITEYVYDQLLPEERSEFKEKIIKPKNDQETKIYSYDFRHDTANRHSPELMACILTFKDSLDKSIISRFRSLPCDCDPLTAVKKTYLEHDYIKEIISKFCSIIQPHWQNAELHVSYATKSKENQLLLKYSTNIMWNSVVSIDKSDKMTAAEAWRTMKPVIINSIKAELLKPEPQQIFTKTQYEDDSYSNIASIVCVPVGNEKNFHGILTITSTKDNFFDNNIGDKFVKLMEYPINELDIMENLNNKINMKEGYLCH